MSPVISIITVVYNGEKVLERTIQSVLQQTYPDIEYIIIDGGSTDGTPDIIKKYQQRISKWIGEKDKGIYDAMNKGMKMATGDYLLFLNAGDALYEKNTIERILSPTPNPSPEGRGDKGGADADIFYGETVFVDFAGRELGKRSELTPHQLPEELNWKNLARGMVVCHQAFIVKKSIAPFYDLRWRYTADIDWMIVCLKNAKTIVNTHRVICRFLTGGFSKKNLLNSWMDRFVVLQKHFGFWKTLGNHFIITFRAIKFKSKLSE